MLKRVCWMLAVLLAVSAFAYEYNGLVIDDETDYITGYIGKEKRLIVPKMLGVKGIADSAFAGLPITEIYLPEGIEYIEEDAFNGCKSLKHVELPASLKSLDARAFYDCKSLREVVFEAGGEALLYIQNHCFAGCKALTTIDLPDRTFGIEDFAFNGCSKLTSFAMPKFLGELGESVFSGSGIKEFAMHRGADNGRFVVIDGCLYELDIHKNPCSLVSVPPMYAGVLMPPETVTDFVPEALYDSKKVTQVIVPSQVETLNYTVFHGMSGLKSVVFQGPPPSVKDWNGEEADFQGISKSCVVTGYLENGWAAAPGGNKATWHGFKYSPESLSSKFQFSPAGGGDEWCIDGLQPGCKAATMVFPSYYGDYPVTFIEYGAFKGNKTLKSVFIPGSIASIYEYAFQDCTALTSVTLGFGVNWLGDEAFEYCTKLATVKMQGTAEWVYGTSALEDAMNPLSTIRNNCFEGCTSLKSVVLPPGIQFIEGAAFRDCAKLASINLPESVRTLEDHAFMNCKSLKSLRLPRCLQEIQTEVFRGCTGIKKMDVEDGNEIFTVTVPGELVERLDDESHRLHWLLPGFTGEKGISDVKGLYVVPYGCEEIMRGAFRESKLTTVRLPATLNDLNPGAFAGCMTLKTVEMTGGANDDYRVDDSHVYWLNDYRGLELVAVPPAYPGKTLELLPECAVIGPRALQDCKNLVTANVPERIDEIGDGAFQGCVKLATLTLPNNVLDLPEDLCRGCTSLVNVTLGNSVRQIECYCFADCKKLASISFPPQQLRLIANNAFENCVKLTSIVIPYNVDTIYEECFMGCTGLTEVYAPGVETLEDRAFANCTKLANVVMPKLRTIGEEAFLNCKALKVMEQYELDEVGERAFAGCTKLARVVMPGGMSVLDGDAFAGCTKLATVVITGALPDYGAGQPLPAKCKVYVDAEAIFGYDPKGNPVWTSQTDFAYANLVIKRADGGGNYTYEAGAKVPLQCILNDSAPIAASWSIVYGGKYATVDKNGKVTFKKVDGLQTVVVKATAPFIDGTRLSALYTATVYPKGQVPLGAPLVLDAAPAPQSAGSFAAPGFALAWQNAAGDEGRLVGVASAAEAAAIDDGTTAALLDDGIWTVALPDGECTLTVERANLPDGASLYLLDADGALVPADGAVVSGEITIVAQ